MAEEKILKVRPEEDSIHIQDIWKMLIANWHWFFISISVCLSIAAIYISVTSPVYTRKASVLIKDDSKSGASIESAAFDNLDLFKSNSNVNNEMQMLKSPLLMKEVVQRLGLDENYELKNLRSENLYGRSPIKVVFKETDTPVSLTIELLPGKKFVLTDFISGKNEVIDKSISGVFSQPVSTPLGMIMVEPTSYYSGEYLNTSIQVRKLEPMSVAELYASTLNVALNDEKATIINLSIDDTSIRKAEDILNTLIDVYNENWIKDKNQVAVSTSNFIDERLAVIEKELGHVDSDISDFKSENLLPDVQAASGMYMVQASENDNKQFMLNSRLSIAQYMRKYLTDDKSKSQLLPTNSGIENLNIESQISEYNTLLLQRERLIANSSEKNPLLTDMNVSLEAIRKSIIGSVDNLIETLKMQIADIKRTEIRTNQRIASSPGQAKYLLSVERQQKVKEALYLYLLQKREENELSQAFTAYNTRMVNPPSGSFAPTFPRKMPLLMLAFVIGFMVPALILYMLEAFNNTVRGRKDLETLTIPFIGEVPLYKWVKKMRKQDDLGQKVLVQEKSHDIVSEAFRVVRTNMDFMKKKTGLSTITMLTSFNPGSGKTFVSLNLSMSFALAGKKVLVIDLDLRKASLSHYVSAPKVGMSNYLSNMVENIDDIILKERLHPNLDILPTGAIPPNPTELLLGERLPKLLDSLRQKYDYIFIDCTPVEILADTAIIGKWVDLTLFIVREGLLDRRMLPELENLYRSGKYGNMAVLLNGSHYISRRYGYRYGYGYGYSYSYRYGYGNDNSKNKKKR